MKKKKNIVLIMMFQTICILMMVVIVQLELLDLPQQLPFHQNSMIPDEQDAKK